MNDIIYFLAKQWVEVFIKKPLSTSILSILMAAIGTGISIYAIELDQKKQESKRLENNNYQLQLTQLNDTEKNIKQLLEFVKSQQASLRETEDSISKLRSEREKLQPLVELDKSAIEAIFRAQEERVSASVWRERIIGFVIGIVASLIASFIWYIATIFINKSKIKD
jgi:sensor c-di-GMP phosphodiesterase-like protein